MRGARLLLIEASSPIISLSQIILLSLLSAALVRAQSNRVDYPWRTEPEILTQIVDVQTITDDRSLLAPGYLYFAPETFEYGWGPKIYSMDGLLIWDGHLAKDLIVQQFHVCDFAGQRGQHLCWHESSKLGAERNGVLQSNLQDYQRIYDNAYNQVGENYTDVGELSKFGSIIDSHEFHFVGNGTSFVQTIYVWKQMDLRPWEGPAEGWIKDGCFQEVDVYTRKPFFTWCFLDHLPLDTNIWLHTGQQTNFSTDFGGDGTWWKAWDFYHPNSVDKNFEGDYILSGRHADEITKIAGPGSPNGQPGDVLWRFGGPANEFEFEGGFGFTRQHHARFVATTSESTVLTLFDNAWEGESDEPSQPYSSGKLININNATKKANLIREYPHPNGDSCRSGGSMQMLPNGNIFIGWGFITEVTEFHINGTVLYHGAFASSDGAGYSTYRSFKYPWVGIPAALPKLIAYSQSCVRDASSPLHAYVSWNGATEVIRWHFYTSEFPDGPWKTAGTFRKTDFETDAVVALDYRPYVAVEALDKNDMVLSRTSTTTFVPSEEATAGCDEEGCFAATFLTYEPQHSCADGCERDYSTPKIFLIFFVMCIELVDWFLKRFCYPRVFLVRSAAFELGLPSILKV